MNKSSTRGIFLSIAFLFSITLLAFPSNVYGEEVSVSSIALEETSVLELKNDSNEEVNTLRIWLGSDFNFKSFKTEKGWTGEKNSQGVIIFTSSESIKPGESVKFGVKTDKPNPGINWKALDKKDTQVDTGITIAKGLPTVVKNSEPSQTSENTGESMTEDSIFRIVPEKPNVGSSIRVTGDNFGSSQEFDFYIDTKKLGSFTTDNNGHFMTTMKIPDDQKADRVDFKVKDKEGEEKKLSLRIGEVDNRIPESQNIPLTIKGIPDIVYRGDFLEIFGTGEPGSAITADINTPEGNVINTRTAEVDSKGDWKLDEPVIVALDSPFGKYSATISDGRDSKLIYWTIESDKKIIIAPTSLKFEPGEIMKFNGTALPNIPIELVLEDPLGKEVVSDILQIDESGNVYYEYQTTQITPEGTYTLVASQEKDKEFIFAGVGQLPTIPVNLEFDKLNYKAGDTAIISLSGKASEIISLLIINPSDKPTGDAVSITLQPDGRGTHSLNLDGFASGVYTAVISKGSTQSTEIFTVGLVTGSGDIDINTTKIEYHPGDSILILGDTGDNVLLTITLTDPDGNEIKTKETFSDKNGKISEGSFRIPSDGKSGVWNINAKSGSNFDNVEIDVVTTVSEGMVVSVEQGANIPGLGDTIIIKVFGAEQNVTIEIVSDEGEIIGSLEGIITSAGIIDQLWAIPAETEPGTYTIIVTNPSDSAETTYELQ
ncbi:biofilm-associated protein [Nitrosopumilus cobalaminigenes]|uniref:Biofilm-associated protein n=1 Tax=Nitrosopumilus cobalaminigenes TaxID=1470066 RepID=A0A7D5M164_9ARCH|nr:biofilm-associated protein [Nitrosopumilus cobalaminigenes]QLH03391.1 biofilm-associated protein [Nitrosopumilus cobalaminigenes]